MKKKKGRRKEESYNDNKNNNDDDDDEDDRDEVDNEVFNFMGTGMIEQTPEQEFSLFNGDIHLQHHCRIQWSYSLSRWVSVFCIQQDSHCAE